MIGEATSVAGPLLDEEALTRRIFQHLDNGTTDLAPDTWAEPVENYRSPGRLAAEVELVLRRHPSAFCPSAALAEPGSYLARDAVGVPLVAVRGRDGKVRAFRNACRHRGTAIASGQGCAKALVCPYHGWVYGLDGGLRQVPDEFGFPGLDKARRGLVPVRTEERGGLVFVTQDEPADGATLEWLPELVGPGQALLSSGDVEVEANWKVLLEGFLEGYHLKATHRDTFLPFGYDNVNVVETFGSHSRVAFPFRRIEGLRDRPGPRRLDGMVTFVHHVFPNTVVARLAHHTTVVVLEPVATDRTRFVTFRLGYQGSGGETDRRGGAGEGSEAGEARDAADGDAAARDAGFVDQGAAEDLAVACAVQRGLASGANEVLTFGRFEGAIRHFHRRLHELLPSDPQRG